MNNATTLTEKKVKIITWSLLFIMPVIGMAVDLIAPSLPAIAMDLQVANHTVKNTISIYLLGYALGNFFMGFLTDAYGRKQFFRYSLFSFILVSLLPVIFPSISVLLISRLLQGVCMGATAILIRAVLSDIYPAEKLVRLGVLLGTMWGLGPVLGPILGGYLQSFFGWKAGFYFFSISTLLFFSLILLILPETHKTSHPLQWPVIKRNMTEVLSNGLFMSLVILMGFAYSLLIVFNTMAPFLIQTVMHHTPVFFGRIAFYLGCIFLVSTLTCRHLLTKCPIKTLYLVLINSVLGLSIVSFLITLPYSHSLSIVVFASALMFFNSGFLFPMSMGKGMSLFRHIAGTASAIMYLINILITSLFSLAVSFIPVHSFTSIMGVYLVLVTVTAMIYWGVLRKRL